MPDPISAVTSAVSIGSSFLGAKKQADAMEDAQARQEAYDRWKYEEDVNRAFAGDEQRFKDDFWELYDATDNIIGDRTARAKQIGEIQDTYRPMIASGDQALGDAFSGQMLKDERTALAPVNQARTNVAKSRQTAISKGLQDALSRIKAGDARKGFVGGSMFTNNQMSQAQAGARQQAAVEAANAELQNQSALYGLTIGDMQRRLALADAPFARANQVATYESLPAQILAQDFSIQTTPVNFFRNAGVQAPQSTAQFIPNSGMALAGAIGQGANAYGQHRQNQALIGALNGGGSSSFYGGSGFGGTFSGGYQPMDFGSSGTQVALGNTSNPNMFADYNALGLPN